MIRDIQQEPFNAVNASLTFSVEVDEIRKNGSITDKNAECVKKIFDKVISSQESVMDRGSAVEAFSAQINKAERHFGSAGFSAVLTAARKAINEAPDRTLPS